MPNPYSFILRNDKGSALTHTELDNNFRYLQYEATGNTTIISGLTGNATEIVYFSSTEEPTSDSNFTRNLDLSSTTISNFINGWTAKFATGSDLFGMGHEGLVLSYEAGNEKFYNLLGNALGLFRVVEIGYKDFSTGVNNVIAITDSVVELSAYNGSGETYAGLAISEDGIFIQGNKTGSTDNILVVFGADINPYNGEPFFNIRGDGLVTTPVALQVGGTNTGLINFLENPLNGTKSLTLYAPDEIINNRTVSFQDENGLLAVLEGTNRGNFYLRTIEGQKALFSGETSFILFGDGDISGIATTGFTVGDTFDLVDVTFENENFQMSGATILHVGKGLTDTGITYYVVSSSSEWIHPSGGTLSVTNSDLITPLERGSYYTMIRPNNFPESIVFPTISSGATIISSADIRNGIEGIVLNAEISYTDTDPTQSFDVLDAELSVSVSDIDLRVSNLNPTGYSTTIIYSGYTGHSAIGSNFQNLFYKNYDNFVGAFNSVYYLGTEYEDLKDHTFHSFSGCFYKRAALHYYDNTDSVRPTMATVAVTTGSTFMEYNDGDGLVNKVEIKENKVETSTNGTSRNVVASGLVDLTSGVATQVATITLTGNSVCGGMYILTVEVSDGSLRVGETQASIYTIVHTGGTELNIVKTDLGTAESPGTNPPSFITMVSSITDLGGGVASINVIATSSPMVETILRASIQIMNNMSGVIDTV